jgi:hypothetical protein
MNLKRHFKTNASRTVAHKAMGAEHCAVLAIWTRPASGMGGIS